jgi:AAA15 family ATPase/GTPase
MLKRIYIDNYKCLVNFELRFDKMNILLGENGSGKSTVFETLQRMQSFIGGDAKVEALFPFTSRCRWQNSFLQTFEMELEEEDMGMYQYRLTIEHTQEGDKVRVKEEKLLLDGNPLFNFEGGEIRLYNDYYKPGPQYPFDWSQSVLATIYERKENTKLTQFKKQVAHMIITQVVPPMMQTDASERGDAKPSMFMQNFANWYRFISQDQGLVNRLIETLRGVLEKFDSFRFVPYGTLYLLETRFQYEGLKNSVAYNLNELSDGQRVLLALYTLLEFERQNHSILCLDEPDNFIALPEVQPWLTTLYDLCSENGTQALLISHHPEVIDLLSSQALWLERPNGLATRVSALPKAGEDTLKVSEVIARRWVGNE